MSNNPQQSKAASAAKPVDPNDTLARLIAAEEALKAREEEIVALKAEADRVMASGGLRYSPKDRPFVGDGGGYEFTVTPKIKEGDTDLAHLKPVTVRCCDESEALRWYCQAHEMKVGSGKAVDPVKVHLSVVCLGRERADAIMRQRQISVLRRKVESGAQLNETDQELLATCENEIYGFGV